MTAVESPEIQEIYLSAGDEIAISVYGQPDLSRQFKIPFNGQIFYPMVGEISIKGQSVRVLRQLITDALSARTAYKIAPGDELSIQVYRHGEISTEAIVPSDGIVSLPLAGELDVADLTLAEAAKAATQKLEKYIRNPQVTTHMLRYNGPKPMGNPQVSIDLIRLTGQRFFVLGEVRSPGVYPLSGPIHLLDAVAAAGGLRDDAKSSSVLLVRSGGPETKPETHVYDLDDAVKRGIQEANPELRRGDVVYVPETAMSKVGRFFGHIERIVRPFVDLETGIWLGQNIDAGPTNRGNNSNDSNQNSSIIIQR